MCCNSCVATRLLLQVLPLPVNCNVPNYELLLKNPFWIFDTRFQEETVGLSDTLKHGELSRTRALTFRDRSLRIQTNVSYLFHKLRNTNLYGNMVAGSHHAGT